MLNVSLVADARWIFRLSDVDGNAVILSSRAFVLGSDAVLLDNFDQSTLLFSFETASEVHSIFFAHVFFDAVRENTVILSSGKDHL